MAEIRIEEKKNSWLPLLLGLAALLLIGGIAFAMLSDDDDDVQTGVVTDTDDDMTNVNTGSLPGEIVPVAVEDGELDVNWDGSNASYEDNYIFYMASLDKVDAEMGLDHEYSKVALMALANSLVALAREQGMSDAVGIEQSTSMIREKAKDITVDWRDTEHADMIRTAAMAASDVIDEIQDAKFPGMDDRVAALEEQAKSIQPGTLTLDQKANVKKFYRMAADVLGEMRG